MLRRCPRSMPDCRLRRPHATRHLALELDAQGRLCPIPETTINAFKGAKPPSYRSGRVRDIKSGRRNWERCHSPAAKADGLRNSTSASGRLPKRFQPTNVPHDPKRTSATCCGALPLLTVGWSIACKTLSGTEFAAQGVARRERTVSQYRSRKRRIGEKSYRPTFKRRWRFQVIKQYSPNRPMIQNAIRAAATHIRSHCLGKLYLVRVPGSLLQKPMANQHRLSTAPVAQQRVRRTTR